MRSQPYFAGSSFDFADALFESTSAQATVGLSSGITNPSMSPVLESIYIFKCGPAGWKY
ncbi:MAG: hypothetical protein IPF54_27910 [Draconibacterium sp.]|nr:hypothetical protein [Draconibacterium sp.]